MPWNPTRRRARQALDARLAPLRPTDQFRPPAKGWIRAIRDALGLSAAQLAGRLDMRSQSIDDFERSEAAGKISLANLERIGRAMDCTLVYALVPNASLEDTVQRRARHLAQAAVRGVSHTMALEDQAVFGHLEEQIAEYIEDYISERDIWKGDE